MFKKFIDSLAAFPSSERLFNPYEAKGSAYNSLRRHNLNLYLQQMHARRPSILLVGEAPGYRGCRLSGIPFVSCTQLQDGIAGVNLFGLVNGYRSVNEWENVRREASATMMWQTIGPLPHLPLLWNALPFHPHQALAPQTNRTPTRNELDIGGPFLARLCALFSIQQIIAVGNQAHAALSRWEQAHKKVRHPSHGGKYLFQKQLVELF